MAATAIARIDIQTGNAVRKLQQLGKASKNLALKVGGAASKIGGLQGVLGRLALAETGRRMVSMAATFKQTELRLKLLSQEHGEFAKAEELAARAGKKFGLGQTEALQGITDIYARLRPLGTSLKDIESTYVGFNTVAKLSGVNAMQASAAFTQLAQALGSGRLQGDEFRSIAEQVPGLLTAVAEETGKSVGELKAFASQGKLTSDILIKALKKVEKDGAGKIASIMKDDPTQKFKNLQNAIETLSIVIGNDLLPAVTPIIEAMTKVVLIATKLPGPIKTAGAAVIGFGAAFLIAAPVVAQIVGGIKVMSAVIMAKLVPALIAANVAGGPWVLLLSGIAAGLTYFGIQANKAKKAQDDFNTLVKEGTAANIESTKATLEKVLAEKEEYLLSIQRLGGHRGRNERKQTKADIVAVTEQIEVLTTRLTEIHLEQTAERIVVANKAMKALGNVTDQTSQQFQTAFATKLMSYMESVNDFGTQSANIVIKSFQGMEDSLVTFVRKGKLDFRSLANSIINDMIRMAVRAAIIKPILGSFGGALGGLFGGGRAAGGPVTKNSPYVVGERGPELFVPNTHGKIVPNKSLGGGGGPITVNVDASGSSVEGKEQEGRELGKAVAIAVQNEMILHRRPGGLLA